MIQLIHIAQQRSANDFILNLSRMMATTLRTNNLDRVLALQFLLSYKTVVTSTRVMCTISLNCLLHFLLSSVLFFDKKLSSFVSCALLACRARLQPSASFISIASFVTISHRFAQGDKVSAWKRKLTT